MIPVLREKGFFLSERDYGKEKMLMKKISCNVLASIVSQLVACLYGLVVPRLILGHYGSEVNGLTQSIVQFLGVIHFLDMGLGQVVCSSLYGPLAKRDFAQVSRILASGRKFYGGIGIALAGYVALLMAFYPRLVSGGFGWAYTAGLILVLSISSFAQYFFGITNELLLQADQKQYVLFWLQIFCNTLSMAVCICLLKLGSPIHAVRLAAACVYLLKPLYCSLYIRRRYPIRRKIRYGTEPISQKWSGIAQHVSAVVLDGTDNIVLTLCSSLSNVSIYSVYYLVIANIQGFYSAATAGIQSAAGAVWAGGDEGKIQSMFTWVETALHLVTVFLFTCTGLLIVPFVRVYTEGLTDADYIQPLFASVLVLAYGIRSLRTPYNIWILAAGHFRQTRACHITAAAVNLAVSILGVFRFGLLGVALGTLVAMCVQTVWLAWYAARNLVKCSGKHLLRQCLADAVAAALILSAAAPIRLPSVSYLGWFTMAIQVALTAILCIGAVTALFHKDLLIQIHRQIRCRMERTHPYREKVRKAI